MGNSIIPRQLPGRLRVHYNSVKTKEEKEAKPLDDSEAIGADKELEELFELLDNLDFVDLQWLCSKKARVKNCRETLKPRRRRRRRRRKRKGKRKKMKSRAETRVCFSWFALRLNFQGH